MATSKTVAAGPPDADALDALAGPPSWYHPLVAHVRETRRDNASVQDLATCNLVGDATAPVWLVHEYLVLGDGGATAGYAPATEDAALKVNATETLEGTNTHCGENHAFPTFVAVDFFELGGARTFVSALNMEDAAAR